MIYIIDIRTLHVSTTNIKSIVISQTGQARKAVIVKMYGIYSEWRLNTFSPYLAGPLQKSSYCCRNFNAYHYADT